MTTERLKIDVHQHLWSEPLVAALAARSELPLVRDERGLQVLYLAGEQPYVIDAQASRQERRAEVVRSDGLDLALLCLSSPIGIECLPRRQAAGLIDAYHEGALDAAPDFGVWGTVPLERAQAGDVDRALDRGCVGISLPAGALANVASLRSLRGVLERLQERESPLFVHPGPGLGAKQGPAACGLEQPLWWPALTSYVADMQAAWLAFGAVGRREYPRLAVIFSMLAGLAPLQAERLQARGGPALDLKDPLTFYDTSSYGARAIAPVQGLVGASQVLYGSDRPVVEPAELGMPAGLDWAPIVEGTARALGGALR